MTIVADATLHTYSKKKLIIIIDTNPLFRAVNSFPNICARNETALNENVFSINKYAFHGYSVLKVLYYLFNNLKPYVSLHSIHNRVNLLPYYRKVVA